MKMLLHRNAGGMFGLIVVLGLAACTTGGELPRVADPRAARAVAAGHDDGAAPAPNNEPLNGGPSDRSPPADVKPHCVEQASQVGLVHTNHYGPVVAESEVGMIMQRNLGQGAAVGDYDDDGDLDVYLLAQAGRRNRLFRNELDKGTLRFSDVTLRAGIGDTGLGRVAQFADLDDDGDLDLLVVNDHDPAGRLSPSRLFANNGDGTFSDATAGSGFHPVGYVVGGAALADVNGDGDLDIYLAYWTRELGASPHGGVVQGIFPGSNRLYENTGELTFEDVTATAGLGGLALDSFTPILFDFDSDGDADLYQTVDHRPDLYFDNIGGGSFVDQSQPRGVLHRGNDMGVALADVDGNGRVDLFVSNIFDPQQSFGVAPPGNTLLLQRDGAGGPGFVDAARQRGVYASGWGWGAAFVDFDGDGDEDLYTAQGFDEFIGPGWTLYDARSIMFENDGAGHFAPRFWEGCALPGDQRTVVVFDANRDGAPDLLMTQVALPVQLLMNQSRSNWLTVQLRGHAALIAGAMVEARVGERVMRRAVVAGGSYLSGPPRETYFGLGSADGAEVAVVWADGTRQEAGWVAAGSVLPINSRRAADG